MVREPKHVSAASLKVVPARALCRFWREDRQIGQVQVVVREIYIDGASRGNGRSNISKGRMIPTRARIDPRRTRAVVVTRSTAKAIWREELAGSAATIEISEEQCRRGKARPGGAHHARRGMTRQGCQCDVGLAVHSPAMPRTSAAWLGWQGESSDRSKWRNWVRTHHQWFDESWRRQVQFFDD